MGLTCPPVDLVGIVSDHLHPFGCISELRHNVIEVCEAPGSNVDVSSWGLGSAVCNALVVRVQATVTSSYQSYRTSRQAVYVHLTSSLYILDQIDTKCFD